MRTGRDGDEIVLHMKAGKEAGGFARFLKAAADAFQAGHIAPTNAGHHGSIDKAADQVRALADTILEKNS